MAHADAKKWTAAQGGAGVHEHTAGIHNHVFDGIPGEANQHHRIRI